MPIIGFNRCTILYCTINIQYCTQYCTVQESCQKWRRLPADCGEEPRWGLDVFYCTLLDCTGLYSTVLYWTVLYCTLLDCTLRYSTGLYSTVLYWTVLYWNVYQMQHCSALYYTTQQHNTTQQHCSAPRPTLDSLGKDR